MYLFSDGNLQYLIEEEACVINGPEVAEGEEGGGRRREK